MLFYQDGANAISLLQPSRYRKAYSSASNDCMREVGRSGCCAGKATSGVAKSFRAATAKHSLRPLRTIATHRTLPIIAGNCATNEKICQTYSLKDAGLEYLDSRMEVKMTPLNFGSLDLQKKTTTGIVFDRRMILIRSSMTNCLIRRGYAPCHESGLSLLEKMYFATRSNGLDGMQLPRYAVTHWSFHSPFFALSQSSLRAFAPYSKSSTVK